MSDMHSLLVAAILGVVEGLTEFLPVSSTGHMIIVGHLLGFEGDTAKTFEVVIQLGSILAVVVMFSMFALQRRQALVLAGVALLMLATVMRAMTLADPFRYRVEVEAVHLGVTALVLIGVTLLSLRMARLRQRLRDQRTALARALEKLSEIATRDELTGLPNRRAMGELLLTETARHARLKAPLSLALLDIDHFKQINDRLGHAAGDEVLRGFAQRIEAELRGADVMARWGGEEFLLLLPGTAAEPALQAVERLRESLRQQPFACGLHQFHSKLILPARRIYADAPGAKHVQPIAQKFKG